MQLKMVFHSISLRRTVSALICIIYINVHIYHINEIYVDCLINGDRIRNTVIMLDVFLLCHFICTHKLSSNMIMIHQHLKFSAYYRQSLSASNTNSARFTSRIKGRIGQLFRQRSTEQENVIIASRNWMM